MAKLLKLRRGTTSQHASFTGAEGEVTIDTTKDTAVVHDGSQAGGRPLAREDMSNVSSASIAGQLGTDSIATAKIAGGALPTDVTVTNANVVSNAAIAGTKVSPDFGSQNISTTGTITATGTASTGQITAKNTQEPQIIVQDSDTGNTGTAAETGISFRDGGGTQQSMIGHNNSGDKDFYLDTAGSDHRINFRVGGSTTQLEIENSAVNVTGNIAVSGTVDGRDVAADGSKLDGIDSGAKDDQTKAEIDALNINADQVDGLHASSFLRSDANDSTTGTITINNSSNNEKLVLSGTNNPYIQFKEGNANKAYIQWIDSGILQLVNSESNEYLRIASGTNGLTFTEGGNERTVWHAGNDGSGSGLDADTLDGVQGSNFLRSDQEDTITGSLNVSGGTANGGNDATLYVQADNNNDWGIIVNKYRSSATEYGIESRVASGSSYALSVLGNGSRVFRVGGNGDIVNSGSITASGNVTAYSDQKLKTDIHTINDALGICGKLRGVSYKWIADGKPSIGVIAQEVEKVLPEVVLTNKEVNAITQEIEEIKSVDYGKMVGVLINAINELKAEVDELKGGK